MIAGDDDEQLRQAARTLSLTRKATLTNPARGLPLIGDTVVVPELLMPPPRNIADAPRWLPLERGARLASCSTTETLQTGESSSIPVYFHMPPNVFYGERENLKLNLHYRYSAQLVGPGSALRIVVNGQLVNETLLPAGTSSTEREIPVSIPVTVLRPFGNTIFFNFDFIADNREASQASEAPPLKGEILCDSSIDLHGLALWTRMPNLELFADAGFPFTQKADLSDTTVILPTEPSSGEVALYLHLMSHFGAQTGYPVLRVTVAGPNVVLSSAKDYLVLGTAGHQPVFGSLAGALPVTLDSNGIHVRASNKYVASIEDDPTHSWSRLLGSPDIQSRPSDQGDIPAALIEEIESPSRDRSFVLIALRSDETSQSFSNIFLDESLSHDLTSTVSLLRRGAFESYAIDGPTYHAGSISGYAMMRLWFTRYFLLLLIVVTVLSLVLASWVCQWLRRRAQLRLRLSATAEVAD